MTEGLQGPRPQEQVLNVSGVGKEYRLYTSPRDRLKTLLTGRARHRSHWALKNVSFDLQRGQCLGVVGNNGAGKSSLLKLLAGTIRPTTGTIHCSGRITAILELGAGFHPDFSGRDNLYFAGSLIGINSREMARLEPEIIAFSELGEALERPVKTYSSGMTVRLAFALVTAVQPDLLIIDEALAVGDQNFQKKCVDRITAFRERGCTILFCSHSLYHVRHLCDVALWLDAGSVRSLGSTDDVLADYEAYVREQAAGAGAAQQEVSGVSKELRPMAGEARSVAAHAQLVSVDVAALDDNQPPQLQSPDLQICIQALCFGEEPPSIGVMLEQAQGVGITSVASHVDGVVPTSLGDGLWQVTLTFPGLPLHTGEYVLSAYLFDARGLVVFEEWAGFLRFKHTFKSLTPGLVTLPHRWS